MKLPKDVVTALRMAKFEIGRLYAGQPRKALNENAAYREIKRVLKQAKGAK